jgi:aminoglycoside phosphotransferase (APT) family kinase protein
VDLSEPFASGRDADLFGLDAGRVLRRYRAGGDATVEAAVMRYVAAHNYPVPAVHEARDTDIVMDRLNGPTMFDALGNGGLDEHAAGAILAALHDRLHLLPARLSSDPAVRILHVDLHPGKIESGPVVIDWRNTTEGDPNLDVAMTALVLAEAGVSTARLARSARSLLATFLAQVEAQPVAMFDEAVVVRSRDPNLSTHELQQLEAASNLVLKLA